MFLFLTGLSGDLLTGDLEKGLRILCGKKKNDIEIETGALAGVLVYRYRYGSGGRRVDVWDDRAEC
jgi:hypothetical protein